MIDTPALDHLLSVKDKTQAIHDFLEWLGEEHDVCLAVAHDAITRDQYDTWLAEYHGVDLKAVEAEKQALLEYLRCQG